jgi:O-antigen ligase
MTTSTIAAADTTRYRWLETAGQIGVLGFVAAVQFSLWTGEMLLWLSVLAWLVAIVADPRRAAVPSIFWPLAAYAAISLVSVAFSLDPPTSLYSSKQMLLFLAVPVVYRFARGDRANTVLTVLLTVGALSAVLGVVQYGVLGYDSLARRVQGSLGHWMTYSGLLLLVTVAATARLIFGRKDRVWPALIMPALVVAIVVTFTRSAWVGTFVALAVLFALKDFRLVAAVPVLAAAALAVVLAIAPAALTGRVYSVVNVKDPTSSDRIAMLHAGVRIVRDHPLTGVGLDNVKKVYRMYRDRDSLDWSAPHLHNVPIQIAAERGLPALGVWLWFIVALAIQLLRRFRRQADRVLPAAALGALAAMVAAGMFEYNFGDSEFLMTFLVIVTLPFAAEAGQQGPRGPAEPTPGTAAQVTQP